MPRAKRVTGRDVAERAGVSRATVSYVLNDAAGQPISAETRARVLAAAADLGYTPDAAARQLRTGVSDLVLLAIPPFPVEQAFTVAVSSFTQRLGELGLHRARRSRHRGRGPPRAHPRPAAADRRRRHRRAPLAHARRPAPRRRHPGGDGLRRPPHGLRPHRGLRPVRDHPGGHDPPLERGHRSVAGDHARRPGVPVVPRPTPGGRRGRGRRPRHGPDRRREPARPRPGRRGRRRGAGRAATAPMRSWPTTTTTPSSPCGPSSTPASACPTTSP